MSSSVKNTRAQQKRILLVEDEEITLKTIAKVLEKDGFSVTTAPNGETARNLFALQEFDVVISDIHMPGKISGIELFHFVKKTKPIPVILMTGFATLAETREAEEMGVDGFLAKPFKTAELEQILLERCGVEKLRAPEVDHDAEYCKIGIDDFISGRQIQFNIFARLSSSKYVRIAFHGEDLTPDRIEHYKGKGIRFLYLLQEDFQNYMRFNLGLAKAVKISPNLSKDKKLGFMKHTTEVILENVYRGDMDEEIFEHAKSAVETTVSFLAESNDLFALLEALNKHSDALYAHCVGVSTYAGMLAKQVGWHSPQTFYKVTMGGLLHDIGKKDIPKEILEKPRTQWNVQEIAVFESHALRGLENLSRVESVPGDVLQIVQQHHERDLGTGYPMGLKRGKIHPLARLVAVADEFCYWVIKSPGMPELKPEEALQRLISHFGATLDPLFLRGLCKIFKVPVKMESA